MPSEFPLHNCDYHELKDSWLKSLHGIYFASGMKCGI